MTALGQAQHNLSIKTDGAGLYELTGTVARWLADQEIAIGLLTVFVQHTSASLVIQENADPAVQADLQAFFERLVPSDGRSYLHASEGPDDMPAHIKGALTQTSLGIPVVGNRMALGTWQGLYLFEHRRAPHRRAIQLHLIGGNH